MKEKINLQCTFTFCGDEVSEIEKWGYYFSVATFCPIDTWSSVLFYTDPVWPVSPLLFLPGYNASKASIEFGMTYDKFFYPSWFPHKFVDYS